MSKTLSFKIGNDSELKLNEFLEKEKLDKSNGLRKLIDKGLELNPITNPKMDIKEESKSDNVDLTKEDIRTVIRDEVEHIKPQEQTESISSHLRSCPECDKIIKSKVMECTDGICKMIDKRLTDLEVIDEEDLEDESEEEDSDDLF